MPERQTHTTFGTVEVLGRPTTFDNHHVLDRGSSVFVNYLEVTGVKVRFGWGDMQRPICGKCRSPLRAVASTGGSVVWLASDDLEEWSPYCPPDDPTSDAELIAAMWHERDRSVGSWCTSASLHVDDSAGALMLIARTDDERLVIQLPAMRRAKSASRQHGGRGALGHARRAPDATGRRGPVLRSRTFPTDEATLHDDAADPEGTTT
ncbi:MAG: hypothetical protein M3P34_07955 [Actinomycetota bacterium]|nr:hypothetical protein [Actinomycetota bacterium]